MNLVISNLHAGIEGKQILKGVSMTIGAGQVHAVMGPNGSGKSTLASVLLGHPAYAVKSGRALGKSRITLGKKDILKLTTEERAKAGLFLAFQSPIAIPGVTVMNLLRTAYESRSEHKPEKKPATLQNPVLARRFRVGSMSIGQFTDHVREFALLLKLPETLLMRSIHEGFSGGEKKKIEMLQALVLPQKFAVFDEIDTGLDVDALKAVSAGIERLRKQGTGVIIITHYQRILRYVKPDVVHVLVEGKIADTGNADLAKRIENDGYGTYIRKP